MFLLNPTRSPDEITFPIKNTGSENLSFRSKVALISLMVRQSNMPGENFSKFDKKRDGH